MTLERSPSPTRAAWLVGIALLIGFFVGLLLGGRAGAEPERAKPTPTRPAATPQPTRSGAVETATAYVMSLRWDVLIDARRRRGVVGRFAREEVAEQLDTELAGIIEPVRAAVSVPPVVARRALLGTRIDSFDPPRASVSLWGLALFATGAYGPITQWSTSRLDLVWEDERWRVAAVESRGGPSPQSSLDALARADSSFQEVRRVP